MIETVLLTSLDDLDFDRLFADSYPYMEANFRWNAKCDTYDARKEFMRDHMGRHLTGSVLGGVWLARKTVQAGWDLGCTNGILIDGHYEVHTGLVGKDANGSRAHAYAAETYATINAFQAAQGVTSVSYQVAPGGSAERKLLTNMGCSESGQTLHDGAIKIVNGA